MQATPAAIPAVVANILGPPANEYFRVSFPIQPKAAMAALLVNHLTGEMMVEVEQGSPTEFVERASGQLSTHRHSPLALSEIRIILGACTYRSSSAPCHMQSSLLFSTPGSSTVAGLQPGLYRGERLLLEGISVDG